MGSTDFEIDLLGSDEISDVSESNLGDSLNGEDSLNFGDDSSSMTGRFSALKLFNLGSDFKYTCFFWYFFC